VIGITLGHWQASGPFWSSAGDYSFLGAIVTRETRVKLTLVVTVLNTNQTQTTRTSNNNSCRRHSDSIALRVIRRLPPHLQGGRPGQQQRQLVLFFFPESSSTSSFS
jgi:hypothetical protein